MDEYREFVADTREDATKLAATFFGVPLEQLWVHVVPEEAGVHGLGSRTLLIASVGEESEDVGEPVELGEIGSFVAGLLERMGVTARLSEVTDDDGTIVVTLRGRSVVQYDTGENGVLAALSHLADRAAEKLLEGTTARVELAEELRGAARAREARPERSERGGRDRERGGRDRGDRGGRGGERRERGGGGRDRGRGRGRDDDRPPIDEAGLERLAQETAARVRESGKPETLRAMNSRERWHVHNALKDEAGVRSESEGEGRDRRVRLVPS